jgi:ribosomal protein L36
MIDVTDCDLTELVKHAYRLSAPMGLGFLHSRDEPLSDEDAAEILSDGNEEHPVRMDYVHGRCCKFSVIKRDGRLYIRNPWPDHSDFQLRELLTSVGVSA